VHLEEVEWLAAHANTAIKDDFAASGDTIECIDHAIALEQTGNNHICRYERVLGYHI
jgi:hypothetical protein